MPFIPVTMPCSHPPCTGSRQAEVAQGEPCHSTLHPSLDKALCFLAYHLLRVYTIPVPHQNPPHNPLSLFLFFFFLSKQLLAGRISWQLSHPTHAHTPTPSMPIPMIFKHILQLRNNPSVNSFYIYRFTASDSLTLRYPPFISKVKFIRTLLFSHDLAFLLVKCKI